MVRVCNEAILKVATHKFSSFVACAAADSNVYVVDLNSQKVSVVLKGGDDAIASLAWD